MALTTANLVLEYVGKRAAGATPGINSPLTTTWNDNVGSNDATLYTGAGGYAGTVNSGWAGTGTAADPYRLVSDGTTDYCTLAAIPSPVATDHDFSIEMWTLVPGVVSANTILFRHRVTSYYGFAFYVEQTADEMSFSLGKGSTPYTYIGTARPAYSATPLHHVVTYNAAADILNFYRSGEKRTSDTSAAFSPETSGTPTLGGVTGSSGEGPSGICTLRVYSSCLSQTDITNNYDAGVLAASTDGIWTGITIIRDVHV